MLNKVMKRKALALLVAGGALFQFSGCIGLAAREVVVGMGRSLGAIPADLVNELFLADFVATLKGGGDGE